MSNNLPAGAVNLDGLKQRNDHQEQVTRLFFNQQGLRCMCGQNITTDGVELFLFAEKTMVPTEQGPQLGVKMEVLRFCSRTCPHMQAALAERDDDLKPIAIKKLPAVEWLDG